MELGSLPTIDPRLIDYARANASVGINGVVLNNVNADARILTPEYLRKVAAIADLGGPMGFVSISPLASPPRRRSAACQQQTRSIRRSAPGGGGRLTRSTDSFPTWAASWSRRTRKGSRGRRTTDARHADGANMLADALAPHHGTVFWRAFVYSGASRTTVQSKPTPNSSRSTASSEAMSCCR